MHPAARLTLLALLLAATGGAWAADFLSVSSRSAILYDSPSVSAHKLAVASRYLPLEVVFAQGDWVKVRDHGGQLAWVEKRALDKKRYLLVTAPVAEVRQGPDAAAMVQFKVSQQVVLERLDSQVSGWLQVRHPDGVTGYIRTTEVWGD
ncbi:MAG: SH3-like domain-containing protein [Nitrosomonadales bacterium]|nr:SH3-like domain-containing protein [Nitrosomonadales bacterium]